MFPRHNFKNDVISYRQGENICKTNILNISDKGLLSKVYKEFLKFNRKKIIKTWIKDLITHLTEEDM